MSLAAQAEAVRAEESLRERVAALEAQLAAQSAVIAAQADKLARMRRRLAQLQRTDRALRRRMELEAVLSSISQGFIHCGEEGLDAQLNVSLELIHGLVDARDARLLQFAPDAQQLVATHVAHAAPGTAPVLLPQDVPWTWAQLATGTRVVVEALGELPPEAGAERQYWEQSGCRAYVSLPLVNEGQPLGALLLASDEARPWPQPDLVLLHAVADIIANALSRHRIETTLRESERKFAGVFAACADVIGISTLDTGVFVAVNPAFERITGHPMALTVGRSAAELRLWVDPQARTRLMERLRREQIVMNVEARLRRRCGEEFDVLISASRIDIAGVPCAMLITRDITERTRSESVLRAILENIPDPVWLKDPDGRIRACNQALARLCGLSRASELHGRRIDDFLPAEYARQSGEADEAALASRGQVTREEVLRRNDETWWLETVKAPVFDHAGKLIGTTGISHNVTQRKLVEQALRQSEARFRKFAEDLPFFVWMAPADRSRVHFVNRAYETIFGRSIEALRSDPFDWLAAVHPEDRPHIPTLESFARHRGLFISEFRIVRPDGEVRWLRNHVVPLEDERGAVYLHAGIGEDVTERKRAEEEIRRLNAELEERVASRTAALAASLRELESFSYSVSHDLRTPLRAINGFSHVLLEDCAGQLDAEGRGHLQRICAASERMGGLIDDLLTLSRISRLETHPVRVNLSKLAREIVQELGFSDPGREVEAIISPALAARGDANLLRLLLENLLGNAWKFTRRCARGRIELLCVDHPRGRAFCVRDNGAGFDPEYAQKLFLPFQRLHSDDEFPGSGIGLATVKRIVDRHCGRVWAEGVPGGGASFYFTLG